MNFLKTSLIYHGARAQPQTIPSREKFNKLRLIKYLPVELHGI